ncbi:hypothetical protein [Trueperella sp. LYQ141]
MHYRITARLGLLLALTGKEELHGWPPQGRAWPAISTEQAAITAM